MFELILANFALHITLDTVEKNYVQSLLKQRILTKNEAVLKAGGVCRATYFVNKGCLRTYYKDANGDEHNILFCPENWWAVDIASFSGQTPALLSISALEQTEVFCLSHDTLEELYRHIPKFERFFRILAENGFNLYQQRIMTNLSQTAQERYRLFQQQYPKLDRRITQKQIASYLGITPVFLSILRKKPTRGSRLKLTE